MMLLAPNTRCAVANLCGSVGGKYGASTHRSTHRRRRILHAAHGLSTTAAGCGDGGGVEGPCCSVIATAVHAIVVSPDEESIVVAGACVTRFVCLAYCARFNFELVEMALKFGGNQCLYKSVSEL
jgi:hypothetical protein